MHIYIYIERERYSVYRVDHVQHHVCHIHPMATTISDNTICHVNAGQSSCHPSHVVTCQAQTADPRVCEAACKKHKLVSNASSFSS